MLRKDIFEIIKNVIENKQKVEINTRKLKNKIVHLDKLRFIPNCFEFEGKTIETFFEEENTCCLVELNGVLVGQVKTRRLRTFLSYLDCGELKKGSIYTLKKGNKLKIGINSFRKLKVRVHRSSNLSDYEMDIGIIIMQKRYEEMKNNKKSGKVLNFIRKFV